MKNIKKMKMKKNHIIVFVIFLLLSLGVALSPLCNVKSVEVVNIGEENPNFDADLLTISSNFFLFNSKELTDKMMEDGLIASVKIEKKWFLKLKVTIEWKQPVIYLKSSDLYAALDREGYVLNFVETLPEEGYIDGIVVKYAKIGEVVSTENDYITKNAVHLHFLFAENSEIVPGLSLKPRISVVGTDIIQSISDDYLINFGDGEEAEERFKRAIAICEELARKGVKNGIINLRRKNHSVYEAWK